MTKTIIAAISHRGRALLLGVLALGAAAALALTATAPASADGPTAFQVKPDLQIQSATWECTPGVPYCNAVRLRVVVKNGGQAGAAGSFVRITDGQGTVKEAIYVGPLASGQSATVLHNLPTFDCGEAHTRIVKADGYNTVQESNEGNNSVTRTYVYPAC